MENKTVEQICEEMRNDWAQLYFSEGTRKRDGGYSDVSVIETDKVADQIDAAHNRELSKKDAEIAKRDELIKELTDALSQSVINHCYRCKFFRLKHTECKDKKNEVKCWSKSFKGVIAKAMEVLNGGQE